MLLLKTHERIKTYLLETVCDVLGQVAKRIFSSDKLCIKVVATQPIANFQESRNHSARMCQ